MGVLRAGILGNIRGKVAGVVGAQWKDVNYLREYIKPANPNTDLQKAQRNMMADCVQFCKPLVGPVFNAYTDRFQKSMSGFNYFIKSNIKIFDGLPDYEAISLTEGKLSPIIIESAICPQGSGHINITFKPNYGNNGKETDKVFAAAMDHSTKLWYFPYQESVRSSTNIGIDCDNDLISSNLRCYAWPIAYSASLVSAIGNSDYCMGSIA
jgi:hypothetical protein